MTPERRAMLQGIMSATPAREESSSSKPRMTPQEAVEMAESGMEDITAEAGARKSRILEAQRDPVREIQARAKHDKVYREKRTDALSKILQAQRDRYTGGGIAGDIVRTPGKVAENLAEFFAGPEHVLPPSQSRYIQPGIQPVAPRHAEIARATPGINEHALKAATEAYHRALLGEEEEAAEKAVETPAETPALRGMQRP